MRMKKVGAMILAGSMMLGLLAGCGKETQENKETTEATTAAEETTVEETTEEVTEEETTEETLGASDGDVVIDLNFDENMDGIYTYNNGGVCEKAIENGELAVDISNIGKLDYSSQIYYDGFVLYQDCVYEFTFDVHSDIEREIQWRFQINGSDYHAYASDDITIGPETQTITADFDMTEDSDPAPRLCFNMGLFDSMDPGVAQHKVYIDNIKLVIKDASKAQKIEPLPTPVDVKVNQLGYKPDDEKIATITGETEDSFDVIDVASGEKVYSAALSERAYDKASASPYKLADFSDLKTAGKYKVVTNNGLESYEFEIKDGVYDDVYRDSVLMLYTQRCGMELDSAIAGDFAHGACHTEVATVYGTDTKVEVSGGWHDAGDFGRYVVPGAKTVADLFLSYEDVDGEKSDSLGIPESGNGIPDLLDEAKYELDWMLKMQDPSTGGVYHKVTCAVFPETVMPEEETDELILSPISNTATGDFAAVMAKASIIYKEFDEEYADACLEAAKNAWVYLDAHQGDSGFRNPTDIETGEYNDYKDADEYFWAAVELYIATGDETYKTYLDTAMEHYKKIPCGLGWADVGMYGTYDYIINCAENSDVEGYKTMMLEAVDKLKANVEIDGYGSSMGLDYPWGSNMNVANNGIALSMAYDITGDETYIQMSRYQLDYLLGRNAVGYCYVTGYGTVYPEHPHHRVSEVVGKAVPGMLVGGPNEGLNDSYAKAVLVGLPAERCYVDNAQSYSCNEICIYWNSPLIYLLATNK